MLEEHLRTSGFGPAVADVIDHSPSDVARQRQPQRQAGLVLRQRQGLGPPVEPSQFQAAQVSDPQAEPGSQYDHRVVALADRRLPVDLVQDQADLGSRPRVGCRLAAAWIALGREPARQVFPDLTGLVQVAQEIGQARAQRTVGLRGIAPVLAPGPESGQVPGLRLADGFPAGLLQVGQERIRGALLGHDARFGVAPPSARSQILVPRRTETWWAPVDQRRGGLAHPGHAPVQALHQQHQGPACELGLPGTRRLTQARQPAPRPLGHEIEAVHLGREILAAGLQEPGERVQLRLVALDRSTRSACRTQRGDHPS